MTSWQPRTLASRMTMVMILLLLLVQVAGFWVVREAVQAQARREAGSTLEVGERIFFRLLEQNASRLRDAAVVLASDFGFRSAIGSGDVETIASALENSGERIGAGLVAFFNSSFKLVSMANGASVGTQQSFSSVAAALSKASANSTVVLVDGTPSQLVIVPVRSPLTVGWVLMGFPIDQKLLGDFQQLSSIDATLATGPVSSDASSNRRFNLMTTLADPQAGQYLVRSHALFMDVDHDELALRHVEVPVEHGHLNLVLSRSMRELTAPFQALQQLLALITVSGLLLFAFVSRFAAGRVTQPLAELTVATDALEHGNFETRVAGQQRSDEVGVLARGFERMRRSLAAQRDKILDLAYRDQLTGLPNRVQFREHLDQAILQLRAGSQPLTVIVVNVDRFKHVNDVLGYAFGDELLKVVAQRLQSVVAGAQTSVARLGGDQYAVALTGADIDQALAVSEQINIAFSVPISLDGQTVDLSASLGIASWPLHADTAEVLLNRAEIAMHAAKSGTQGVMVFEPALDSSSSQNLSLLSDLREALQQGHLHLYLQPKVDTRSGDVVGAEALVRWLHPDRGMIAPVHFIPFAEQTGFVRKLTLFMFEQAAACWHTLQAPGAEFRIAINISTRDLLDLEFPAKLDAIIARYQVSASGFCLEVTESAIMDDPQRALNTLNALASLGFKLSIDDFGTGYSSLAYLKQLPVNELKVDRSFVVGMAESESDLKIVRSTIDLAHNLGLTVVAEGVEDDNMLSTLADLGCDQAQGYFIGKPMPIDMINGWRQAWSSKIEAKGALKT